MTMKNKSYFGTDGIRGVVGESPMTIDFVMKVAWTLGSLLFDGSTHEKVVVGKDTRISGDLLESAIEAGLNAAGCDVLLLGVMPTPSIAYLTRAFRAKIGIIISASHNPYYDNGIKFFNENGGKLSDHFQREIEEHLKSPLKMVSPSKLGKRYQIDAKGRYIEYCKSAIPHNATFKNFRIVIDSANGSTFSIAPHVFSELGADVIPINIYPNGFNINDKCGTTHPDVIRKSVLKNKADVGIAFDGDGDRVLLVDHTGEILDGDDILYIIAKSFVSKNLFCGGIVGTTMSNTGLQLALDNLGLAFVRVDVGDQNIVRKLIEKKWILGGEPSGHIVFLKINTTGDGIVAALQVLQAVNTLGKSLEELRKEVKKFPQLIVNVPTNNQTVDLKDNRINEMIKDAKAKLGPYSRVILRASGTEPLIRIMVEGEDENKVKEVAHTFQELLKTTKV